MKALVVILAVVAVAGCTRRTDIALLKHCPNTPPIWTDGKGHYWQGFNTFSDPDHLLDPIAASADLRDICK